MIEECLKALGIPFTLDPKLVRGLDYYTKTAFEIQYLPLGAQSAVAGGGRYDGLIGEIGDREEPAVGFATGLERVLLALEMQSLLPEQEKNTDAFIVAMGNTAEMPAFKLLHELRSAGVSASMDFNGRSMKSQMKQANKKNARFALIMGEDEVKASSVTLRDMKKSEQQTVPIDDIVKKICAEVNN